eukprot:Rmarinus@m.15573
MASGAVEVHDLKDTTLNVIVTDNIVADNLDKHVPVHFKIPLVSNIPLPRDVTDVKTTGETAEKEGHHDATTPTEFLGLGGTFKSTEEVKHAFESSQVVNHKRFFVKRSSPTEIYLVCRNKCTENCGAEMRAAYGKKLGMLKITRWQPQHTCQPSITKKNHSIASAKWVASELERLLPDRVDVAPCDIIKLFKDKHSLDIPYHTAWRAQELISATASLQSSKLSQEQEFALLPSCFEKLKALNPSSRLELVTGADGHFVGAFCCMGYAQVSFSNARRMMALGSVPLRQDFPGVVLYATIVDAEDRLCPLAISVVDTETSNSWTWFLREVVAAVPALADSRPVFVLSSYSREICAAVDSCPASATWVHACSLSVLSSQCVDMAKDSDIRETVMSIARAKSAQEYENARIRLSRACPQVHHALDLLPKDSFVDAFFKGPRFEYSCDKTHTAMESLLQPLLRLQGVSFFSGYVALLAGVLRQRRLQSSQLSDYRLEAVGWVKEYILANLAEDFQLEPRSGDNTEYWVSSGKPAEGYHVDMSHRRCSCGEWQRTLIPCPHAVAVCKRKQENPLMYLDPSYLNASLIDMYSYELTPLTLDLLAPLPGLPEMLPPVLRRTRGRPKSSSPLPAFAVRGRAVDGDKLVYKCGGCHELGHNKRRCPNKGHDAGGKQGLPAARAMAPLAPISTALSLFGEQTPDE